MPGKTKLDRTAKFDRMYRENAPAVRSSIARVGQAGRTGDPTKIAAERDRHSALLEVCPRYWP